MDIVNSTGKKIDLNLYSRQIGAYGVETMGRLMNMSVVVLGLKGLGVEVAKNLILAGPKAVTLVDPEVCLIRDMGSNFYIKHEDVIAGKTRVQACIKQLSELNNYVEVTDGSLKTTLNAYNIATGASGGSSFKIDLEGLITKEVSVVVVSDQRLSLQKAVAKRCRELGVGLVIADSLGVAGRVFVDFGPKFMCHDRNGDEPKRAIVAGITKGEKS